MMCTRRSLFGACVLALAGAGLSTGSASAQPASGFYLSQEIGLNVRRVSALATRVAPRPPPTKGLNGPSGGRTPTPGRSTYTARIPDSEDRSTDTDYSRSGAKKLA